MKSLNAKLLRDNSPPTFPLVIIPNIKNTLLMKPFLLVFTITVLVFTANGQITQGNWLVGGTGSFLSSKNNYTSPNYSASSDRIDIKVSPSVGYFIADQFASGLKVSYSKYKEQVNGPGGLSANVSRFEFGPFARYYFLQADKQYNILTEASYQYGIYYSKPTTGSINTFSASAGTVIFFNSSIGLEFLVGYYSRKEVMPLTTPGETIINQKGLQIGIGFQIHLEK